ncbi:MAG: LytTR family DNA-binding domain-containing protein [Aliishimia sp.]
MSTFRYGVPILLQSQQEPQPRQSSSVEPVEKSRFVRRLPEEFVGQILRLSGDGHYVNVSTTQGPFDVRIRLSDAVEEMDCDAGFLVHRSHWVAREAIRDAKKERGRPVLILKTGDTVPVGAKYRSQLEEAGIL